MPILFCLCATLGAPAEVAFSNFGPGDSFNTSTGYTETGLAPGQSVGEGFTPLVGGTLDVIIIAISHISGANDVHLYLSDGSQGTPGPVLESWVVPNLPQGGILDAPIVIESTAQPLLTPGNLYYIYSAEPGDQQDMWNLNSISEQGTFIVSQGGSQYYTGTHTQGAFRVEVTPVPEPPSAGLLIALCGAGMLLRSRTAFENWQQPYRL
ncbi:MAG TPA: hypothetical protein VHH88_06470 [Verrucomicrobiae bacterium]|nr:hypothetical protein [Verrucomicrobiae bacterium]